LFVQGGAPGFVRVTGPSAIAFPGFDGNGMFKSLGNVLRNPSVGLLFIAMHDRPPRLRVNGEARVSHDDLQLADPCPLAAELGSTSLQGGRRSRPWTATRSSLSRTRAEATAVTRAAALRSRCHPAAPPHEGRAAR